MNKKIIIVVNVDWFFLSHRLPVALEARRQGYEVHIATGLTNKLEELERHGMVVHPLLEMDRSSASLFKAIGTMVELWHLFKSEKPDLVHLVTIKPVLLGGLVARLVGIPSVLVAISGLGFVFMDHGVKAIIRRWIAGVIYRFVLGHRNLKVVFQNTHDQSTLTKLTNLPASKVELIRGSGVDLTEYVKLPMPTGLPVVMFAARLLVDKGVREFVQAARILKKQGVTARFCLVGGVDSANPASLEENELKEWEREGVVELWGHKSEMQNVLSAAWVVVLPSYYGEGLPKVLIEAAACGRAVVTTNHPGCRDAIDPNITGLLVPVRNSQALADAIRQLLSNPALCQAMGNAGRELAETAFDLNHVLDKHLRIYKRLIGT